MTGRINYTAVKVGLITGLIIVAARILSILVVYDFFRFDTYLSIVAVVCLTVGYLLTIPKQPAQRNLSFPGSGMDDLRQCLKQLSSRELSILKMIAGGHTNKEIAVGLGVEVSTVKTHINHIYFKINAKNRKEAREKWNAGAGHRLN